MTKTEKLAQLLRYWSLTSTTKAGSGHPTSSMSAADLMASLFFDGFFRFDTRQPQHPNNDRLIFSKGHASPLFYALWAATGAIPAKELMTLREFGSRLEGHPTMEFPYTEAATGSLGQGLSIGVGMALNAKYLDKLPYTTYVLLGDSEMAEGSIWEAMQLATHYKLNNLVAVVDVNRLGQRGTTMYGHNVKKYAAKAKAFGWKTIVIDGHSNAQIKRAYKAAQASKNQPTMIIAKTLKGKGVEFIENKDGWHGKALHEEQLVKALEQLGAVDTKLRGTLRKPLDKRPRAQKKTNATVANYKKNDHIATRQAYGDALVRAMNSHQYVVALDAETSNSTHADEVKDGHADRFFEMYIAEQNMVGTAIGLSARNKKPFVSTFGAFFTRAFDQIRMSQYSDANIAFVGSHAGVSIGEDGSSQMALEDLAMFRAVHKSIVLYPSDAVSTQKLVQQVAKTYGISYIRTTRGKTPLLYKKSEPFPIGGSKVLRRSPKDKVTIVAAGITVIEALEAYRQLQEKNISVRVIDLYSVKPLDVRTLRSAARSTKAIITVEDHYPEGGLGEAVAAALSEEKAKVIRLAVNKMPRSGKPQQLLDYEGISAAGIIRAVKKTLKR